MPIAFVNRAVGFEDGPDTTTPLAAQTHTAGNLIVAGVKYEGTATTITLSDTAGNTYTPLTRQDLPGGAAADMHVQLFYANDILGHASNVITATFSAARSFIRCCALQYSGCDQSNPFDQEAGGNGTGTSMSTGNITTMQADEVLVAMAGEFTALSGYTPGTNYTERWDGPVDNSLSGSAMEDRIVSSIDTYNATMTQSDSGDWVMALASFKAAAEAADTIDADLTHNIISRRPRLVIPSGSFKSGDRHVSLLRKQPVGWYPAGTFHLLQNSPRSYCCNCYPDLRRGL